jgi:tetratricopeptide (TPR) repeat protein
VLYEELALPAPAFTAKLAYAHTLRGRIFEQRGDRTAAANEYQSAIDFFARLDGSASDNEPAEFRLQYGDSLLYLGNLWYAEGHPEKAVSLLERAAKNHSAAHSGNLSFDYYRLTQAYLDSGSVGEAADALGKLSESLKSLPEASRASYNSAVKDLGKRIEELKSRRGPA